MIDIDKLEKKHKAFMRYTGNDMFSLIMHASELQIEMLAEVKRLRKVMSKIGCSLCDECGLSIEEHIRYHTENDVIAGCPFGED